MSATYFHVDEAVVCVGGAATGRSLGGIKTDECAQVNQHEWKDTLSFFFTPPDRLIAATVSDARQGNNE